MQKTNNSIVVSTRIRFARNIADSLFPHKLSTDDGNNVFTKTANAIEGVFKQKVYKLQNLSSSDLGIMLEKHLISPKLVRHDDISGVALSADETISIMINEEDHLREQCILPGLNLAEAYNRLDQIDTALDSKLGFAFDPALGFLTSCITNVGTGMRASVMLFLPGLSLSGKIATLAQNANQIGLTIRGEKGEESDSEGYLYQISNAHSLGVSERDILSLVETTVRRIIELEKEERKKLAASTGPQIKDMIYRAFAILTGAYSLNVDEFNQMLAQVKLGTVLGLLKFKDEAIFDKLFVACQPSALERVAGHPLVGVNENIFRADYVARMLKQNVI